MSTLSSLLSYTSIVGPKGDTGYGITGAPGNYVLLETDIHVTGDYTITTGKNAISAGPIIVDNGYTINVPNDSTWTVV
jgi:hypothetical protein